jgi:hypothetical protein
MKHTIAIMAATSNNTKTMATVEPAPAKIEGNLSLQKERSYKFDGY